jgi:hypothetical protein
MDKWKVFNRDTEAGRLLSKLYGVAAAGKVSYPQPRRRRSTAAIDNTDEDEGGAASSTRSWKTTCVVRGMDKKAEEEKERERKENAERALGLAVPKVGRHPAADGASSRGGKIDLVPRRKTEAVCRDIVEEAVRRSEGEAAADDDGRFAEPSQRTQVRRSEVRCGPPGDFVRPADERDKRKNTASTGDGGNRSRGRYQRNDSVRD